MDGDTYAVASYGTSKNNKSEQSGSGSFIATYDIPTDGSTITKVSGLRHTSGQAYYHSLVKIADDHYALAFSNGTSNGLVKTFYMPGDGRLISEVYESRYYSGKTTFNSFVKMDFETYMLAYTDPSNKGVLWTADIRSDLPFFKTVSLAADNSTCLLYTSPSPRDS